ncbi:RNA-guided endonuclease InsQ/TnpB family protein [Marinithermus hydrothermalis]|uniref:Transposase IS605 OrfB n=1 Tax=Marinithermus hydrothermalis (strain DSM 14884 / JCM 11576 / T1) TaxID=869210 RepID=F2NKI5_MARHT|nr:zinc ribbon domain-containing protein [Marinithermus hydrothermalis]AEB12645.1 transposase IS605 OrfB [Marinithermus hydrothermalis DSM 14884]
MGAKNEKIKASLAETRARRENQRPRTFVLKLQNLSKNKERTLERAFLEAKWLTNWIIADIERLQLPLNKVHEVEAKAGDALEPCKLRVLGAQVKQRIGRRIQEDLRGLHALKQNGHKVGRLGFKRRVDAIPFSNQAFTLRSRGKENRVHLQKLGEFRALGLHQIPQKAEVANAVLVRKPSGHYLHVTVYVPKDEPKPLPDPGNPNQATDFKAVGVDLGLKNQAALSNGFVLRWRVRETDRLKKLQRKLSRKKKGSKNREHVVHRIRREHEKLRWIKQDIRNRVLALLRQYDLVAVQPDRIKGWQALWGGKVQGAALGGLLEALRTRLPTLVATERNAPTTRTCSSCGHLNPKVPLDRRVFTCEACGFRIDRDLNAALNVLTMAWPAARALGLDRPEVTPLEWEAAGRILGPNPRIRLSHAT